MTVVEFFDTNAVENIISALMCAPERVILVGDSTKQMHKAKARYEQIVANHGGKVEFIPRGINRNNLQGIIDVLEDIIATYGACAFDLTGGDDLYLVAVGTVFCAHRDKVQLHRFNIQNGKMYDCDADGQVLAAKPVALTVEESILAYGGRVIYEDEKAGATYRWLFDDDFCADVKKMWCICKQNVSTWNAVTHTLCEYHKYIQADKTALSMCIAVADAQRRLTAKGCQVDFDGGFLQKLQRDGLINGLSFAPDNITFSFKNTQVKQALINAGRALELFVTVMARQAVDATGAPFFDDVMTGVTIDWDGQIVLPSKDVDNEIDVILMKDLVPIFISCKNGRNFGSDELYKLSMVAEKFGGQYAKKALVGTRIQEMDNKDQLISRAQAMQIRVIQDLDGFQTEEEIYTAIQSLA